MTTLGDLMAHWQDDAAVLDALVGLDDLTLLARVRQIADTTGNDLVTVVREEVGRFVNEADDEAWTTLMGRLGNTEDPARTGLKFMLEFGLSREGPKP
jgi:hypothetical protein